MTTRAPATQQLDGDLEGLLRRMRRRHPTRRPCGPGQRQVPAVGPRRGRRILRTAEVAGLGPLRPGHQESAGRVPHRQDLRRLGRRAVLDPAADPGGAADPGMDRPPREPRRLRPVRIARHSGSKPSARPPSKPGSTSPGSPSNPSSFSSAATALMTPSPRRSPGSCALTLSSAKPSACCRSAPTPPRASTASWTPPTKKQRHDLEQPPPIRVRRAMPKTRATATVDRLLHHAHLCQTTGDSVRLSQALAGKGVKPLE